MSLEYTKKFQELFGREPSTEDDGRILRLIELFGMQDVNEFLYLVLTHEYYKSQIAGAVGEKIENFKASVGSITQSFGAEMSKQANLALGEIAVDIVDTSRRIARERMEIEWFRWLIKVGLVLVVYGVICFICGMAMTGHVPFWIDFYNSEGKSVAGLLMSAVLGAPAGWILVLALSFLSFDWLFENRKHALKNPKKNLYGLCFSFLGILGAVFILFNLIF